MTTDTQIAVINRNAFDNVMNLFICAVYAATEGGDWEDIWREAEQIMKNTPFRARGMTSYVLAKECRRFLKNVERRGLTAALKLNKRTEKRATQVGAYVALLDVFKVNGRECQIGIPCYYLRRMPTQSEYVTSYGWIYNRPLRWAPCCNRPVPAMPVTFIDRAWETM